METTESLSLDEFRKWKVDSLKTFLKRRGLAVSKLSKEELAAALAFAAQKMGVAVLPTSEEIVYSNAKDYQMLLTVDGNKLPDPLSLKSGWIGEKDGLSKWPPTISMDIQQYLMGLGPIGYEKYRSSQRNLKQRLFSDYKEGKAFSYFASNWLKEVHMHPISEDAELCFLKAECTPSDQVNDSRHTAWVVINKKQGTVRSAYCTCFAGLGSTCNHVAAILFKLNWAWKNGYINKTCTDRPCSWNHQIVEGPVHYERIADMQWRKPHFTKKDTKVINPSERKDFRPVERQLSFSELQSGLFSSCNDSAILKYSDYKSCKPNYQPYDNINVLSSVDVYTDQFMVEAPSSLPEIARTVSSAEEFIKALGKYNVHQVDSIARLKSGQSSSNEWYQYRIGRITGSVMHRVKTRVKSLRENLDTDPLSLLKEVTTKKDDLHHIPSIKYGNEMEPEARKEFMKIYVNKLKQRDVKIIETGLIVDSEKPFIGASPDGLIECCCGQGILEIKCPSSIAHLQPCKGSPEYLTNLNCSLHLNNKHNISSQVQAEMGVSRKEWCDLFVYSRKGYHLERIQFDDNKWEELVGASDFFFQ